MIPRTETESAVELAFSFGPRPQAPDELIANETLSLPVIYVVCGPAGSGKTTLAKKLGKNGWRLPPPPRRTCRFPHSARAVCD